MIELSIIVLLLIATAIFFKTQKKSQQETTRQVDKVPEFPAQAPEPKITAETKAKDNQPASQKPASQPIVTAKLDNSFELKQQKDQEKPSSLLLPQDSVLRRHYLTYLRTSVEQLLSSEPTDSVLKRHYRAIVDSSLEQALSSKEALDKLLEDHRLRTQVVVERAVPVVTEKAIVAANDQHTVDVATTVATELTNPQQAGKTPEDSILRRHYFTQLCALAEASLPPRPTDSVLKRHWQALSDDAVKRLL